MTDVTKCFSIHTETIILLNLGSICFTVSYRKVSTELESFQCINEKNRFYVNKYIKTVTFGKTAGQKSTWYHLLCYWYNNNHYGHLSHL